MNRLRLQSRRPAALRVVAIRAALFILILAGPIGLRTAAACSCGPNPPCAAAWRADAVFVGTVVDVVTERLGGSLSWNVHKIAVTETLRGSVDPLVTVVPSSRPTPERIAASQSFPGDQFAASSCDYGFEPGRQYVIYARRTADGRWSTSECTGTKSIEEAAEDLNYGRSLPFAEPTGRVYGEIDRMVLDPADPTSTLVVPAAGITVALTRGSTRLTTTTNAEGKLNVQVPAGEYLIAPVLPQTVRSHGSGKATSVPARGCAPVSFWIVSNGRIEGRVVLADGAGIEGVPVGVFPAGLQEEARPDSTVAPSTTTDPRGRFAIDSLLPGRYVLAVNLRWGPRRDAPYPTTYFPGVARRNESEIIDIGEGEHKTGFTFVVSPLLETTLSGRVDFADGRPAEGASVTVSPVSARLTLASATTDGNGAFRLPVLAGATYTLRARIRTSAGVSREVETVVLINQQMDDVRLVIPQN